MRHRILAPGFLPLGALLVGVVATVAVFVAALRWVDRSEEDALRRQAGETQAAITLFARQVEGLLGAGSVVAGVTEGDAERFEEEMRERVSGTVVSSLVLLERRPDGWRPRSTVGRIGPLLLGLLSSDDLRRLDEIAGSEGSSLQWFKAGQAWSAQVVAFAVPTNAPDLLVYGESTAPSMMRSLPIELPPGIDFAVYFERRSPETLIASSTRELPLDGHSVETELPLGQESAILVVGGEGRLASSLTVAAPWLVLGIGLVVSILLAAMVHLARRRAITDAERRALAEQNVRLLQLDRMKDEIVATVSHELRTPLTSILGYLELIAEDADRLTAEHREFVAIVDRNARRLLALVGDLLFVSAVDAGEFALERQPLDLERLVQEAVELHRPRAESDGLELSALTEPVGPVAGDRTRLAQLLDNLLSNAIKFTRPGGVIEVRLGRRDETAVLEIQDTGMGIAEDELPQIFERFYRSSSASAGAVPGTGLGLAIARTIVEAHGGSIVARSGEQRGTTFTVELPLEEATREQDAEEPAALRRSR